MRLVSDLPAPIMLALRNDSYSAGESDYTPSSLNDPPRIRALTRRHQDELVAKASSQWRRLLGQMVHAALEQTPLPDFCKKEERLYAEFGGKRIGGKFDLYVGNGRLRANEGFDSEQDIPPFTLVDFKSVMSYAVVYHEKDGGKPEWKSQLGILGWLARKNGLRVDHYMVLPLLLDWKADEAVKKEYPQKPSLLLDIDEWSDADVEAFMAEKIAGHESCVAGTPDHELPMCSKDERWQRDEKWALHKKGQMDRAVKLEASREALTAYAERKNLQLDNHIMVFRPAEAKRCRFWCPVAKFCDFGQAELAKLEEERLG